MPSNPDQQKKTDGLPIDVEKTQQQHFFETVQDFQDSFTETQINMLEAQEKAGLFNYRPPERQAVEKHLNDLRGWSDKTVFIPEIGTFQVNTLLEKAEKYADAFFTAQSNLAGKKLTPDVLISELTFRFGKLAAPVLAAEYATVLTGIAALPVTPATFLGCLFLCALEKGDRLYDYAFEKLESTAKPLLSASIDRILHPQASNLDELLRKTIEKRAQNNAVDPTLSITSDIRPSISHPIIDFLVNQKMDQLTGFLQFPTLSMPHDSPSVQYPAESKTTYYPSEKPVDAHYPALVNEKIGQQEFTRFERKHWDAVTAEHAQSSSLSGFTTPTSIGVQYQTKTTKFTASASIGAVGVGVTFSNPLIGGALFAGSALYSVIQDRRAYKLKPIAVLEPVSSSDKKACDAASKKLYEWCKKPSAKNLAKLKKAHEKIKHTPLQHSEGNFLRNAIGYLIENPNPTLLNTTQPDLEKIAQYYQSHCNHEYAKAVEAEQTYRTQQRSIECEKLAYQNINEALSKNDIDSALKYAKPYPELKSQLEKKLSEKTACENFNTAAKNNDHETMRQWVDQIPAELQPQAHSAIQACKDQCAYESVCKSAIDDLNNGEFSKAMEHAAQYPVLQETLQKQYADDCSAQIRKHCERGAYGKAEEVAKKFADNTHSHLEKEERHIAACRTAIQMEGLEISSYLLSKILEKMEAPAWAHAMKTGGVAAARHYLSEQLKSLTGYASHGFENWQAGISAVSAVVSITSQFLEKENKKLAEDIACAAHGAGAVLATGLAIADAAGKLRPAVKCVVSAADTASQLQSTAQLTNTAATASTASTALKYASIGVKAVSIAAPLASFTNSWLFNEWRKQGKAPTTLYGVIAEDFCYYTPHAATALAITQTEMFKVAMVHAAELTQTYAPAVINGIDTATQVISAVGDQVIYLVTAHPIIAGAVIVGVCIAGVWYYCENRVYNNHLHNIQTQLEFSQKSNTRQYLAQANQLNLEALKIYPNDPILLDNAQKIRVAEEKLNGGFLSIYQAREAYFSTLQKQLTHSDDPEKLAPLSALRNNLVLLTHHTENIQKNFSKEALSAFKASIENSTVYTPERNTLLQQIHEHRQHATASLSACFNEMTAIRHNIDQLKSHVADVKTQSEKNIQEILKNSPQLDDFHAEKLRAQQTSHIAILEKELAAEEGKLNQLKAAQAWQSSEPMMAEYASLETALKNRHTVCTRTLRTQIAANAISQIAPVVQQVFSEYGRQSRTKYDTRLPFWAHNTSSGGARQTPRELPVAKTTEKTRYQPMHFTTPAADIASSTHTGAPSHANK